MYYMLVQYKAVHDSFVYVHVYATMSYGNDWLFVFRTVRNWSAVSKSKVFSGRHIVSRCVCKLETGSSTAISGAAKKGL